MKRRKSIYFLKENDIKEPVPKKAKQDRKFRNDFRVFFKADFNFGIIFHEYFPSLNYSRNNLSSVKFLNNRPSCNLSTQFPVYVGSGSTEEFDVCFDRTKRFEIFKKRWESLKGRCNASKKNKLFRKATKENIYPSTMFLFAEHLYGNDPHFDSLYDDYYTGGNLCVLKNNKYVIHANGKKLKQIVCSEVETSTENGHVKITPTSSLNTDGEIFEIQKLNCHGGDSFLFRQKHSISINTIFEGKIENIHTLESPKSPFMSSAQDEDRRSRLITTDRNENIKLWNLATSTAESVKLNEKRNPTSSWNTIRFYERDIFLFATKTTIRRYDTRMSQRKNDVFKFIDTFEECHRISSIEISNYENLFYVGTNHRLFTLDNRFIKKEINQNNCIMKWTHQMDSSPLILKTLDISNSDSETILGCSPLMGDMRVFELEKVKNKSQESYFSSPALPFKPPTLEKAFMHTKRKGFALDPLIDLESRINYCLTGMDFYKDKIGNPVLLTSNSLGDVFSSVVNVDSLINEDISKPIRHYEQLLSRNEGKPFYVSDKADLSGFTKLLNCPQLSSGYVKVEKEYDEIESFVKEKRCGKWNRPTHTLYNYKDVLAQDILSIWDVPKLDDSMDQSQLTLPQSQNTANTVSNWLEDSVINNNSRVTIPLRVNDSAISTKSTTPKQKKKKAKTYVRGF